MLKSSFNVFIMVKIYFINMMKEVYDISKGVTTNYGKTGPIFSIFWIKRNSPPHIFILIKNVSASYFFCQNTYCLVFLLKILFVLYYFGQNSFRPVFQVGKFEQSFIQSFLVFSDISFQKNLPILFCITTACPVIIFSYIQQQQHTPQTLHFDHTTSLILN